MINKKIVFHLMFTIFFAFAQLSHAIVGGYTIPTEGVYLSTQVQANLASHVVGLVNTTDPSTHSTCSAVLIGQNVALTAAHCVLNAAKTNLFIVADDATFAVSAWHGVSQVLIHPNYNPKNSIIPQVNAATYDLALVKFAGVMPERFGAASIMMPNTDRFNIWPVVAGYGYTSREKVDVGILRFTLLKVNSYIIKQNFFYADQTNGHGICNGDSGGPVFMTRGDDFVLIGITSATAAYNPYVAGALGKDNCSGTSIFSNVLYYKNWIDQGLLQLSGI